MRVQAAGLGLERFDSCDALVGHMRGEALKVVGGYGLDGRRVFAREMAVPQAATVLDDRASAGAPEAGAPLPQTDASPDYSTTNVQEAGVDEPDLVKTDGRRIFALQGQRLHAVNVSSGSPAVAGSLDLAHWPTEMLLAGSRLLVVSPSQVAMPMPGPAPAASSSLTMPADEGGSFRNRTIVTVVDVTDASKMKVVSELALDGMYVSARLAGGISRLVVSSPGAPRLELSSPAGPGKAEFEAAAARNRAVVESAGADAWLPRWERLSGDKVVDGGRLASCESTYHPEGFSGFGMTTVVTIDPADPTPRDTATVAATTHAVYASAANLYVTTTEWNAGPSPAATEDVLVEPSSGDRAIAPQPAPARTEIHAFDITDPRTARYTASGEVEGSLLNQWALSEHEGALRVATTIDGRESVSQVVTLGNRDGRLYEVGRVGGLGRTERIFAVRFMGPVAYVVTFRQTDPLYVIDLRDAANPKVTGELKIPGYSAYLHPVADGWLLGVGQDATDDGRVTGAQASLFDVRDPSKPERTHQTRLGGSSEVEYDHKAFMWWAKSKLAVLPLHEYGEGSGTPFVGAVAMTVDVKDGFTERGRIAHAAHTGPEFHGGAPIRRSVVVGSTLYTLSEAGLLASDLGSLAGKGWVAFDRT